MPAVRVECDSDVAAALGHTATMMTQLFHRKTVPEDAAEDTFEYHRDKLSAWLHAERGNLPGGAAWPRRVSFCFVRHIAPDSGGEGIAMWAFPIAQRTEAPDAIAPRHSLLLRFCDDGVVADDRPHPEKRLKRVTNLRRCSASTGAILKDRQRRQRQKGTPLQRVLATVAQAALPCVPVRPRRTYTMAITEHVERAHAAAHRSAMHDVASAFARTAVAVRDPEGEVAIGVPC